MTAPAGLRFAADPAVVRENLGEQLILVQLRTGATFRLNRTGQLIWELACAGKSEAEIVQRLTEVYTAASDRVRQDTTSLLKDLVSQQLLQPRSEGLS